MRDEISMSRLGLPRALAASRLLQLVVASLSEALVGLIAFSVARVTGRNLFILTDGIAEIVGAAVLQAYRRAAQLTEVKVTIPQFSELTFVVNNDARQVAWKLFVESTTRIATPPLDADKGIVREALSSLYSLFAVTRETLKNSRPSVASSGSQTVEHLGITMLS
jgi:hypothetical protein